MNRIEAAIAIARRTMPPALKGAKLDMSVELHAELQQAKSLAQASGIINLEEAQTLYRLLGESAAVFNARPIEEKVGLLVFFQHLEAVRHPVAS